MPARQRRHQGGVDRLPSGRYRVRVVDPATGNRVSLGTFDRKGEAESAFAAALTEQGKGAWVNPATARLTLESYSQPWVASRLTRSGAPLRPRVRELYTDSSASTFSPPWGRWNRARSGRHGCEAGTRIYLPTATDRAPLRSATDFCEPYSTRHAKTGSSPPTHARSRAEGSKERQSDQR